MTRIKAAARLSDLKRMRSEKLEIFDDRVIRYGLFRNKEIWMARGDGSGEARWYELTQGEGD